ncbi:transcription antitermination factor NusB [Alphaproteobacteria bacterium]|nr:transcription antitermination factor NusB [Alphaproteobacteria bacterium]
MKVKRNARLAAVQVIFQYYFSQSNIKKIIGEFGKLNNESFKGNVNKYDEKLFEKIVLGVCNNQEKIRVLIEDNLSKNWIYDRIDPTIRSIISLAIFELSFCKKTPHNVILNEYVSIAGLFFNKTNTGFVNGILGKISKIIKENERN